MLDNAACDASVSGRVPIAAFWTARDEAPRAWGRAGGKGVGWQTLSRSPDSVRPVLFSTPTRTRHGVLGKKGGRGNARPLTEVWWCRQR